MYENVARFGKRNSATFALKAGLMKQMNWNSKEENSEERSWI